MLHSLILCCLCPSVLPANQAYDPIQVAIAGLAQKGYFMPPGYVAIEVKPGTLPEGVVGRTEHRAHNDRC
jgi:hypothetical protein